MDDSPLESPRLATAIALMDCYAQRTGLSGDGPPGRYLWTDAFAVCNWLGLFRICNDVRFRDQAERLIAQVHLILGQHRPDDTRRGWLSGLSDAAGFQHPTRGGLRIGKPLPERPAGEPLIESLEWERDGQYFHYLTKWMHALHVAAIVCDEWQYDRWALELATRAVDAFYVAGESPAASPHGLEISKPHRLVWKMSIGLDRPQVDSMGQHDPLDGSVICWELTAAAQDAGQRTELRRAIRRLDSLCAQRQWVTSDALGAGGLLAAAVRWVHSHPNHDEEGSVRRIQLWSDALESTKVVAARFLRNDPPEFRLAFRELGLSIGLAGLDFLPERWEPTEAEFYLLKALAGYRSLRQMIEDYWLEPSHQLVPSWTEHRDINSVMLATSLVPQGYYCWQ